jgi:arylamine N-acetyltransferase
MTAGSQRYMKLLGFGGRPTGLSGLRAVVQRHLFRVPFENVSKLLLYGREGRGRVLQFDEYLDGIEFGLGGTCYTNNAFLASLLRELDYDADLLGADMSKPNVHACVRVPIDGQSYHVDVGFAAPFRDPVPYDRMPQQMEEGENRYVFERHVKGVKVSMYSGGRYSFSYVAHGPPRTREFFDPLVLDSFSTKSTFMQCLRISRVFADYSMDLIDRKLYRHQAGRTTVTELETMDELRAAVSNELGMPRCPIEAAAGVLEQLTGKTLMVK